MMKKRKTKNLIIKFEKTKPYKRKGRKLEFYSCGDETSSDESVKHHTGKHQYSSESSDDNKKKKK